MKYYGAKLLIKKSIKIYFFKLSFKTKDMF